LLSRPDDDTIITPIAADVAMTCRWIAVAFVLALGGPASAADWPSRPIKIIAPSTAGGAADTFARLIADRAGPMLGATIIVENRTGGGGLVGVATTARAEPDGYTLVMSSAAYNTIEPFVSPNPGFDPARDFTHIAYVGGQANTFIVSARAGFGSLKAVVDAARGGKTIDYVTPGVGTVGHLLMESFARAAGVKLQHIPHRGASQAMVDLIAGVVPLGTMTWSSAIGQIRANTVKPVAVSSAARVAEYPDVPTLRDLGYDLMADSWFGLSGPPGLPPEIVGKLHAAVVAVMNAPDVRAKLAGDAITPSTMSSAEFTAYVAADIAKWQPVVRQVGLGK
jgi:tripartite-type tricarboxylate transporter receptor subunit TctC